MIHKFYFWLGYLILKVFHYRYNLDDPTQNLAAWIIFKYKLRLHIQKHQRKAWYSQELSRLRKRIPELREALKVWRSYRLSGGYFGGFYVLLKIFGVIQLCILKLFPSFFKSKSPGKFSNGKSQFKSQLQLKIVKRKDSKITINIRSNNKI